VTLTVALLGGESTGKSSLAHALHQHLQQQAGLNCVRVLEHVRLWCERERRAPLAHEQAALAAEQTRLIDSAAAQAGVDVVLADTTALVVAAYSAHYFQDFSLFPAALDAQRRCGLTLLMGLDLPWQADGLFRESPAVRDAIDALLRQQLQAAGLPYQTVYGQGEARLQQALRPIGRAMGRSLTVDDPDWDQRRRPWNCEKCSDPGCEHRLFTGLLKTQGPQS
jgi:HTH-type transcriptional regulator, transcriptional repressor of NAD biosynthesis genes